MFWCVTNIQQVSVRRSSLCAASYVKTAALSFPNRAPDTTRLCTMSYCSSFILGLPGMLTGISFVNALHGLEVFPGTSSSRSDCNVRRFITRWVGFVGCLLTWDVASLIGL
ncbi:hypothetical protein BDW60DRAFT_187980 [Aspergillus nidulans var. acristatus]